MLECWSDSTFAYMQIMIFLLQENIETAWQFALGMAGGPDAKSYGVHESIEPSEWCIIPSARRISISTSLSLLKRFI